MSNTARLRVVNGGMGQPLLSPFKTSGRGQVETILKPPSATVYSPQVRQKILEAKAHYEKLGAGEVFEHVMEVVRAAVIGRLINPGANESDQLTMRSLELLLYHALVSESYLPTNVDFSSGFHGRFEHHNRLKETDASPGDRSQKYAELMNDPSMDLTDIMIAARVRVADMMTVRHPATLRAASTRMPGVFPVHSDWDEVSANWAEPALRTYCPVADWGGNTVAYRMLRDNAMRYLYPREFAEMDAYVSTRMGAVQRSVAMLLRTVERMSEALGVRVLLTDSLQSAYPLLSLVSSDTMVVAVRPFKGTGGLLNKSKKRCMPVDNVHDWSGATAITESEEQMYSATEFLHEGGMRRAAAEFGITDLHVNEPDDYARNPKPVTLYRSVNMDAVTSDRRAVSQEWITRTVEMHIHADEGDGNHENYKDKRCPLRNGKKASFREAIARMSNGEWMGQP